MNNRTRLSCVLAFFMSLFIAIIMLFIGFSIGLGDKKIFQNTISQSGYYESLGKGLEEKTRRMLSDYRLPEELGTELWTQVEVYRDMNQYSKNVIFQNLSQDEVPDFVIRISEKISQRLDVYYDENKPCGEIEWNQVKDEITAIIISDYHNSIRLPLLEEYPKFCEKLYQHRVIAFVLCGTLCFGIIVLLFCMYKHKFRSLRYVYYSVFSSSIINIVFNYVAQKKMVLSSNYLEDESYMALCNEVVKAGFEHANIGAYVGLVFGLVLIGTVLWMKEKNI